MRDIEITKNMDLGYMSPLEQHNEDVMEENVDEKAVSKSQQRFFGMVDAYKKGELDNPSKSVKDAADGMSMKQVKDFAKTKHKGLPNHVDESALRKVVRCTLTKMCENINLPTNEVPSENVYTMEDWRRDGTLKVAEGQLIAPDVYFQLLESVPPASTGRIFQPGEAYSYDWKRGVQLYQTFKNEGNNYYRYVGLKPLAGYGSQGDSEQLYHQFNENVNEISHDTIDNAYIKAVRDTNVLPYGTPERVRRDAQVKNIKKLRNDRLGFDPVEMSVKMRQQGTSGDPAIDRKWATWQRNHNDRVSGKRTYDDKVGKWVTHLNENELKNIIRETVQTHLVNVLGKYTQGKVSSKEANKAIMDLANDDNTLKNM